MENLTIVVPFEGASCYVPIWAFEEKKIDFRRDRQRAERCTMSFAAMELEKYIKRTVQGICVQFSEKLPEQGVFIQLAVSEPARREEKEWYSLEPCGQGVAIHGNSRAGLLYGAYEFLKLQGWQWLAPGEEGEIAPIPAGCLVFPQEKLEFKPAMPVKRGFHMEGVSKESEELCCWMARNRLNTVGLRPGTSAPAKKLGMYLQAGGHIFEEILDPDKPTASGKTFWEEHRDWYGLPAGGAREKEKALKTQFCTTNEELMEFLGSALVRLAMDEWKDADQIDLWGFDTWGMTCTCEACSSLGNGSDGMLRFLSAMRGCLGRAREEGCLDHDVTLIMCSYEGTATLQPPMNPISGYLASSGDFVTFAPINRCYVHGMFEEGCETNRRYREALKGWLACTPSIPVLVCEYYNVSKFEDLPLLFNKSMAADLPGYFHHGVGGMYYMHVPLVNWGMRTVTQNLFAAFTWDPSLNMPSYLEQFLAAWYGPYALPMKAVYSAVEKAWTHCSQWRAWASDSVLSALQQWDGAKPPAPLALDSHFPSMEAAAENGLRSQKLLEEAAAALNAIYAKAKDDSAKVRPVEAGIPLNPVQARKSVGAALYEQRLGEDRRLLRYGLDTMTLMTGLVRYYIALYEGDSYTEELWADIEAVADKLDLCYMPIDFQFPGAGLVSRDALTRSQLGQVLKRCRSFRIRESVY